MELLDRYLEAVKKHLPWERPDDLVAELRANLEAQLEDKEAALGRALTKEEAAAWIRQMGAPRQLASHYWPQRYLIGPRLFPTYTLVLKLVFLWLLILLMLGNAVHIVITGISAAAVAGAMMNIAMALAVNAAVVTLIFAAIEIAARHNPEKHTQLAETLAKWDPAALPPVSLQAASGKKPRSLASAVAELISSAIFLVWLLLVPHYPFLILGPGAYYLAAVAPFRLVPVWVTFYWWAVGLMSLQLIWHCIGLALGTWRGPRSVEKIVLGILGLVPLVILFSTPDHLWVVLKHPAADAAHYGATLNSINQGIYAVLVLICVVAVVGLAIGIRRAVLHFYRNHAAAMR